MHWRVCGEGGGLGFSFDRSFATQGNISNAANGLKARFINVFFFLFLDERNNRVVQKEKDTNEPLFEGFIAFMRQVWQSNIILQK